MSVELDQLRGMRLGQLERTILVNAPPQGTYGGLRVEAPEGTQSAQRGYLRAAKKLAGAGLIIRVPIREAVRAADPRGEEPFFRHGRFWLNPDPSRRHFVERIYAWATPFGHGIAQIYAAELTGGKPIRWSEEKLRLARRYEQLHPVNNEVEEEAIELIESRLLEEPDDQPREAFREWLPEAEMTDELKFRWRCSAQLARRENPTLGSTSLRGEATAIYGSKLSTTAIREKSGPLPGRPTASGIRFKRVELIGNVLTPAGRRAAAQSRSEAAAGPAPGSSGG